jgi:hypothetical protein
MFLETLVTTVPKPKYHNSHFTLYLQSAFATDHISLVSSAIKMQQEVPWYYIF